MAILGAACFAGPAAAEDTFPHGAARADILLWLAANSDLKTDAVVAMTDEVVVAITNRQEGPGVDGSIRLTLREEVISPAAAAAWGGRSIQLDLDLDCPRLRVMLGARRIYASPNLQGPVRLTRPTGAWAEAPPGTVIDEVVRAICSPQPALPILAARSPAEAATAASAPPVPGADGPTAKPAARAAASVALVPRQPDFAVQIAAVASANLARARWQSLKAELPELVAPLTFAVEPVSANGRTIYRALLLGFASPDDAAAACKALRSRSVDCVLRPMR